MATAAAARCPIPATPRGADAKMRTASSIASHCGGSGGTEPGKRVEERREAAVCSASTALLSSSSLPRRMIGQRVAQSENDK